MGRLEFQAYQVNLFILSIQNWNIALNLLLASVFCSSFMLILTLLHLSSKTTKTILKLSSQKDLNQIRNYIKSLVHLNDVWSRKNIHSRPGPRMRPQVCTMIKQGHGKLLLWRYNELREWKTALNFLILAKQLLKRSSDNYLNQSRNSVKSLTPLK